LEYFNNFKQIFISIAMAKSVKFEIVDFSEDGYHWLIECHLNGNDFHLVLDTGASRTVIDKNILGDIELEQHPNGLVLGFNSQSDSISTATLKSLYIGNVEINNFQVAVSDLSFLSSSYYEISGVKIGGVLGCDFLMNYVTSINIMRQRINFKNIGE